TRMKHEPAKKQRIFVVSALCPAPPHVRNADLPETEPMDHPADVAIRLGEVGEGIAYAARDQAEIAAMCGQFDVVAHPTDEAHGEHGWHHPERRFAGPFLANAADDVKPL